MKLEKIICDYYKIGDTVDTKRFGEITIEGYIEFLALDESRPFYFPFTTHENTKYLVTEGGGLLELLGTNERKTIMK